MTKRLQSDKIRLTKGKTLNQIKRKGSGTVGKEKDNEKKMEVHTVVFVCSTFHCAGTYIQLLSVIWMDLRIL